MKMIFVSCVALVAGVLVLSGPGAPAQGAEGLSNSGEVGRILDREGVAARRGVLADRWGEIERGSAVWPGDWLEVGTRGANALALELAGGARGTLGPGTLVEVESAGRLLLSRGELAVDTTDAPAVEVRGPGATTVQIAGRAVLGVRDGKVVRIDRDPAWLVGYRSNASTEALGSLLANIDGRNVPLTIGYHKVTVDVRDQIARTVIEESFENHTSTILEGVFYFPLPADASISGFGMWIDGELVQGDIVEKARAREIYETILRERRDPGLLEWTGGNIFKARVYPIGSEKRVRIAYTQVLAQRDDVFTYDYALESELLRQTPLRRLEITVDVHSARPIASVECPSHTSRIRATEHSARVAFAAEEFAPEGDFRVVVRLAPSEDRLTLIPHRRGDDGYFMLLVDAPPLAESATRGRDDPAQPIELLILADTSGSMWGPPRTNQVAFVEALVAALGEGDRFNLATCDIDTRWAFELPQPGDFATRERALSFLEERDPLGWTDLEQAVGEVCARAGPNTHVVYVGDGVPTSGSADPVELAHEIGRMFEGTGTFHAVVPGSSSEMVVLRALAALGGGSLRSIGGASDPARTAFAFLEEITSPAVKDLAIEFDGLAVAAVYPERLPNLPAGGQQIVVGRFDPTLGAQTGTVRVVGRVRDERVQLETALALNGAGEEEDGSFVPRLWARHHLDHLLDQGSSAAVRERIIALSEAYQIVTPYSSFLVLESDADRERFGVEQRFRMRDGEEFFTGGREGVQHELLREQMLAARGWRRELRERVLLSLEGLGRELSELLRGGHPTPLDQVAALGYAGMGVAGARRLSFAGRETERSELQTGWSDEDDGQTDDSWRNDDGLAETEEEPLVSSPAENAVAEERVARDARYAPSAKRVRGQLAGGSETGGLAASAADRLAFGPSWYHDPFDALFPAIADGRVAPPMPDWPTEVLELLARLDRRARLFESAPGWRIRVETDQADARARQQTAAALHLVGPDSWLTLAPHVEGQTYGVDWLRNGRRGTLREGWRLGRVRAAREGDVGAWSAPFGWAFGDRARQFDGYEAELATLTGGRATITFSVPANPRSRLVLTVELERALVLEEAWFQDGEKTYGQRYEDFVEVGGQWWPEHIRRFRVSGVTGETTDGGATRVAVEALDADELAQAIGSQLERCQDAILLDEGAPTLVDAKQAVQDGTARLEERWALLRHFAQTQRWDAAAEHFDAIVEQEAGKPGLRPLSLVWLRESRRNEELRRALLATAGWLAGAERDGDYGLASELLQHTQSLHQGDEVLDLLDALEPVCARRASVLDARLPFVRRRLQALANSARPTELFEAHVRAAAEWPADIGLQIALAELLAQRGEVERSLAGLARVEAEHGPWQPYERTQLRTSAGRILWGAYRLDELCTTLEAWDREDPTLLDSNLYGQYLSALVYLDREAAARERVESWLALAEKSEREPHELARLHAAIQHALGQGHALYHQRLDDDTSELLARTAHSLVGQETATHLAGWILQHWYFRQSDAGRELATRLFSELEESAAELPPQQLSALVGWLRGAAFRGDVGEQAWDALLERVFQRWLATENTENTGDRAKLAQVVVTYGDAGLRIRYYRQNLEEASDDAARVVAAGQLARALLAEPWSEPVERQLVSLVSAMAPRCMGDTEAGEALERNTDERALLVYDLLDWILREQTAAMVEALPDFESMPRRILQTERDRARRVVRARCADLMGELERSLQPRALSDWARVERIFLLVESGERLDAARSLALELLGDRIDALAGAEDPAGVPLRERILAQRCIATCTFLLVRDDSTELEQHEGDLRGALGRLTDTGSEFPDGHTATRDLLIALDRGDELATTLETWFEGGGAPDRTRWGRDWAHVLAERGALERAVRVLEEIAGRDELTEKDLRALSGWYTALDRPDLAREAQLRSYEVLGEDTLASDLYRRSQAYHRSGDDAPPELEPEIPLRFSALMRKARDPQRHFWVLRDFYASTKDHRLLECLPQAVIGHTAQGIYPFLAQVATLAEMIDEEATVDRLRASLVDLRNKARTDVDRRALALLEFQIVLRAARQAHGTQEHAERSLTALRAAFSGEWEPGELAMIAEFLASQGRVEPRSLAEEQLRQLRALRTLARDADERFAVAGHLARTLWTQEMQDDAIRTLETALGKRRDAAGGTLPEHARESLKTLSDWLVSQLHFRRAEALWQSELAAAPPGQRSRWLRLQLLELYRDAVLLHGEVSLGRDDTLYTAVLEGFLKELDSRSDEQDASRLVQALCDLWEGVQRDARLPRADGDVTDFAFGTLPRILELYQYRSGQQMVSRVSNCLQALTGPETTLRFLITRAENEPGWLRLQNQDFWSQHAWRFAASLQPDTTRGNGYEVELEHRALAIVQRELREDLRTRQPRSRYVYDERHGHFWTAMRGEFLATALAFAEERRDAPQALAYASEYLFHGLSAHPEAIEVLTGAHRRGILDVEGRDQLAGYLQLRERWGDSLPIVRALIEDRPGEARYRVMLMLAHFHTSQLAALMNAFEEAESTLRANGHWDEGAIATLAEGCLRTDLLSDCVRLYDDAIALHVRTAPRRGVGDGLLCTYYRNQADAWAGLGSTSRAVDAAAGAIVSWGPHVAQRAQELGNLVSVLDRATDLEGYVDELDARVRASGLENPIVRKALGQVWLRRDELERAAEQLTLASRMRPEDTQTHELLLGTYERQERPDRAADALLEWCRQAGHDLRLYADLGWRLAALEQDERAERAFTSLVELSAHESEGHRLLAEIRERQERWEEAAECWRQVARIRPGEPTGYLGLARSLIRVERFEEARELIEELRSKQWPARFGDVGREADALLTARG